ncbi:MAG: protein translocase subunit SecF, partial [Alphaproteobacteria bacterium]|nr:protein translocase subunit SecF [Alphaproteobacteria bacterium]
MRLLKLIPAEPKIDFLGLRRVAIASSLVLVLASVGLLIVRNLNLGIDFAGGVLIEVELNQAAPLADLRAELNALPIGDVTLQEFGAPEILLLRFVPHESTMTSAQDAIGMVKTVLQEKVKDFRRTEMVGPSIGAELQIQALEAIGLSLLLLMVYIWFRFEWQFSIGAILALSHDIILTLGFYSLTGIEFNLSSVAVLLTIAGYSINDTVVIYDRVREDIRRFKTTAFSDILNYAVNQTL